MLSWFPGHMHKATKEFRKKISSIDIAIEIVDSRAPSSSSNHILKQIVGNKPIIKILSKSDLADPNITQQWLDYYKGSAIAVNTLSNKNIARKIINIAQKKLPNRGTALKPMRTIIFGIPNVGKSAMINNLAGRKVAKTGNEPSITKLHQRIDIDKKFVIFDTPGIMLPNPKNQDSSFKVASIGSIRDTAMDYESTACFLIKFLINNHLRSFISRYNKINVAQKHPQTILKDIANTKSSSNIEQIAKNIVHDYRNGYFGKLSLEDPKTIELENSQ